MNGQQIPGYYFDTEKNKYFKIQHGAAAQDRDLKYSISNVQKKEKEQRAQKAAAAKANKTRRERVVRRHASSFAQTNAEREVGFMRRSFYMQRLWPDACMSGMRGRPKQVVGRPPHTTPTIRLFERDPVSKTVYAVQGENRLMRRRSCIENGPPPSKYVDSETEDFNSLRTSYELPTWHELGRGTSTISSLTYLPATGALATTTYGSDRPPTVLLSDPERDGPYVGQLFTPKGCTAIWGAAARPASFSPSPGLDNSVAATYAEHLAVAASNSVLLFTRSPTGSWDSTTAVSSLSADVLALEWISYTTFALGCRDGKIRLYDTRSGGSSHILTHPYPLSKIKRADDETRLVCSGLQDTLFLYDIRSPRLSRTDSTTAFDYNNHHYNAQYFNTVYPGRRNKDKRRKLNHTAYSNWSQPVLSFPHTNLDDLELDLTVHSRLGLVAAAQNEDTSSVAIRVSNLWTGKTVKEFKRDGASESGNKKHNRIRSLQFVDREAQDGGVELWTCWDGGIARFGW